MIPGFRLARRLVITAVVLAALFVLANILVEHVAEDRIGIAAQQTFGLAERPKVDISGFPILFKILRGDIESLHFTGKNLKVEGLSIRTFDVRFGRTHVKGGLIGGGPLTVRVGEGEASAEVDQSAVNDFLKQKGQNATVVLRENRVTVRAVRNIGGQERTLVASGRLELRDREMRFVPTSVTADGQQLPPGANEEAKRQTSIHVRIPKLPGGIVPTGVESHLGFLRIVATLKDTELALKG